VPQPELRTERLVLRPFRDDDVSDAAEYRNDAEFVRFLPHVPYPFTRADAEQFVALNMSEDWRRSPTFAVVLDGRLIGTANLEVDHANHSAMLGYAIGRQWWGRGLVTEAARAVIAWGTKEFRLTRIWASTDPRHARSRRVLEKLGMQREADRKDARLDRDGRAVYEVVYALHISDGDGRS
jgi:ribosomal-protein-alanine N-acetyltransferase